MKKYIVLIFWAVLIHAEDAKQIVEIDLGLAHNSHTKTLPMVCGVIGDDPRIRSYAEDLKKSIEWSGQVQISIMRWEEQPKKKRTLIELSEQGYALGLIISALPQGFEWRLYDLTDASMLGGKKVYSPQTMGREDVFVAARDIWRELMSQNSPFTAKIAFLSYKGNTTVVSICSYDGQLIREFKIPAHAVGLSFNESVEHPRLLTSELTNRNVKLVSLNFTGQKWDVFNFSGTCVGVSVYGNQALYGRSGDIWHFTYKSLLKQGVHTKIISNEATNMSPTQLPDGTILFCTDIQEVEGQRYSRGPKIAIYHTQNKRIELITQEGTSLAPSYCAKTDQIVYSKKINGQFQLFIYDRKNKFHKQLSTGTGNKTDARWSPCGSYVMYCCQKGNSSSIAQMHCKTGKIHTVSPEGRSCVSPCWINAN